jgi:hypothetical protein
VRSIAAAIAALLSLGCSDLALHAAYGKPGRFEPLSVASPGNAWRNPDGSIGLCMLMNVAGGPWPLGTPAPEGFEVQIPSASIAPELTILPKEWKESASYYEGGAREPGTCGFAPTGSCTLALEPESPDSGPRRLRLRDAHEILTTLELRSREPESGMPLFWPLVPVAYAGDAAMAAVYFSLKAVVVVMFSPVILVDLIADPGAAERAAAQREARAAEDRERQAREQRERLCGAEPTPSGVSS